MIVVAHVTSVARKQGLCAGRTALASTSHTLTEHSKGYDCSFPRIKSRRICKYLGRPVPVSLQFTVPCDCAPESFCVGNYRAAMILTNPRVLFFLGLSTLLILLLGFTPSQDIRDSTTHAIKDTASKVFHGSSHGPKYAFATYLTGMDNRADEDHVYFIATRMLGYQLMHAPATGTNNSIPFIVMITPNVRKSQRDRLTQDGAIIIEVEDIAPLPWQHLETSRYMDQFTKLRIMQLTQYDRIFFLDSDMYISRRIDDIFTDPAYTLVQNKHLPSETDAAEGVQPNSYLFAAANDIHDGEHNWPPPDTHELNSGCFLFQPSNELFEHYMAVFVIPERFPPQFPEQGLLNYVHRQSGNMPFVKLDSSWNVLLPNENDWKEENRPATIHAKWWYNTEDRPGLPKAFNDVRTGMAGFYDEWDKQLSS